MGTIGKGLEREQRVAAMLTLKGGEKMAEGMNSPPPPRARAMIFRSLALGLTSQDHHHRRRKGEGKIR